MEQREFNNLIGLGLYTPSEAAHLTGVPARTIIRWLKGYRSSNRRYEPLWQSQVTLPGSEPHLGFLDLLEVRVVALLLAQGLSAQSIRKAIKLAREELRCSHPLATHRFSVEGKRLILSVIDENGDESSLDLLHRQFVLRRLIERSLRDIEFDRAGPLRWWPQGRAAGILVDPSRSFGRPVEEATGVPADILSKAVESEGSEQAAARAWSVPLRAVRRARAFCRPGERKAA